MSWLSNPICQCTPNYQGPRCENLRQTCGGVFENPNGTVKFPIGPEGTKYPGGLSCAWVIKANYSKVIKVIFTKFSLEEGNENECKNDYLQVL